MAIKFLTSKFDVEPSNLFMSDRTADTIMTVEQYQAKRKARFLSRDSATMDCSTVMFKQERGKSPQGE
ncbi:hypothetical protein YUYDRAFT_07357 [Streptomyces sp. ScaeMP-e48]|nr:hypothetical protein YUYDRAFT_07357 [Streptomyces sp. ScaeMP-e48]